MKVALGYLETGVPMLVLETAKPEKFADTITEALGTPVPADAATQALLDAPQHVINMANDEQRLRDYITEHAQ